MLMLLVTGLLAPMQLSQMFHQASQKRGAMPAYKHMRPRHGVQN